MPGVDLDSFRELLTEPGARAVGHALAALDAGADPLAAAADLRRRFDTLAPDVAAAALTQASLRRRARAKFGAVADRMWFTPDGLEQSTRAEVAAHRAARFAALPAGTGRRTRVADLCCGIGGDLLALARAGCDVTGFERDPLTVEAARANLAELRESLPGVPTAVECLDVETLDVEKRHLEGFNAVFVDPARRSSGRRLFDVRDYSPRWPFVAHLLATTNAAAKLAPGLPHDLVPSDAEAEWISYRGDLKEAVIWSGSLATPGVRRRASVLPAGATLASSEMVDREPAPIGPPHRYLYEPDDAVVRAHLVAALVQQLDGELLDATTAYLTSDRLVATPFAQAFEIDQVIPFSLKTLRADLRRRDIGSVTIMKRGSAVDVERLRRDLRLRGEQHAVVVLALIAGRHRVLICQSAAAPSAAASPPAPA